MKVFIGESSLDDYLYLKKIIEKWAQINQQDVSFYWFDTLYYQIPQELMFCDLIFLEIDMEKINGLEFAKLIRTYDSCIPIVFQTRNKCFGIESYQVQAKNYLLKPLNQQDVFIILEQVQYLKKQKLLIYRYKKQIQKIIIENIVYIEAYKHHVIIHEKNDSKICYMSLKEIFLQLDEFFYRCHRSYIVNIREIDQIEGLYCMISHKYKIPISKKYRKELTEKLMRQI